MKRLIKLAGDDCNNGISCPAVWDTGDPEAVYVVGEKTDVEAVGLADRVGPNEIVNRIPRGMWESRK
ncbi:MAG: hypothetical protein ACRDU9_05985 [Acidimicrobiia bacterium]